MHPDVAAWAAQAVGKTERFCLGVIDALWSQRYAVAVDDLDPLYFDEAFAVAHGYRGLIAPPNYVATMRGPRRAGPADGELLVDGMALEARPPLPNLIGMGGGQAITFHNPVYCGERIFGTRTLTGVSERRGRSGSLIVIEDEIAYESEVGEAKLSLRNTLLCRVAEGAP